MTVSAGSAEEKPRSRPTDKQPDVITARAAKLCINVILAKPVDFDFLKQQLR